MNKTRFWIFLLLFSMLILFSAFSEGEILAIKIDSLRKEYALKNGIDKISTQLELGMLILGTDKTEALNLANSALLSAKAMKNSNLEMRSYLFLGKINQELDKRNNSDAYYDSALTIAEASRDNWYKGEILYCKGGIKQSNSEELKALEYFNASLQACRLSNNFRIMGSSYSLMGTIYRVNGLYDRAIEYIIDSKLNYDKAGFSEGNAWAAYLLGRIYADLRLPQKALEYFQESLKFYSYNATLDGSMTGVAICLEQIGLLNLESGNYKEAHTYFNQTYDIFVASKSEFGLSNASKNLGLVEYYLGNYETAEKHFKESLKVKMKIGDMLNIPTIYEYQGLCLIAKGKSKEGFNELQNGLTLAISNNQKKIQLNIYSEFTKAYLKKHDLQNAFRCQKQQIVIQDLLLSGAANIKFEQLQRIYEIDRKNSLIAELEKQNEINALKIKQHRISQQILIVGILVALLISMTVYWFYNQIRSKNLELKESNAAKDKFFAIIAHDLRGPIGTLTAFLVHLLESFDEISPKELKGILLTLHKSAENVSGLLENLLIWAQSQLNKVENSPTKLELTNVIQTSVRALKQVAENKQIDIKFELDDQIMVYADPNMVQTILRNILSNAIKFTNRGGLVIIRSSVQNMNNAIISIIDNGVGIEESSLTLVFDITKTFHTVGTENEKSTGLGLILVKEFIEKNGGKIAIESEKDKGTTVSFTLPTTVENMQVGQT